MTELTFLGTGTSQGVPVIACGCEVCSSTDHRDKRLRSAAMVERDGTRIIIDAGPDFRQQMLTHNINSIDGIVITHEHKDHVGGIDDVRAYNYFMRRPVDIYATRESRRVIEKDFDYAFEEEDRYPGVPRINMVEINGDEPFRVRNVDVLPIKGLHFRMPVLGFRIGGMAYLTDFSSIEDAEIEKIKGVEVLVINALRREKHISHFTLEEALRLREKIRPERTYITHVSHQMGRYANISGELPDNTYFAYDGLKVRSND